MNALDGLIPEPQRLELDHVDVAAPPGQAWRIVRHGNLARSPIVRALFAVRTLPARLLGGDVEPAAMRIDDIVSAERPGFRLLAESELEVAVGAIGKVWELDIPFVDVRTPEEFLRFEEPGYAKVAWALRVIPRGESGSRIEVEVRVSATDDESWRRFRRYFRIIGPASRFIRHHLLSSFVSELGAPAAAENKRPLAGDDLLPDAAAQMTDGITIMASPEAIWPWLVQMGCRRAGWYSYDFLDNAGIESAREIHPELQEIEVGKILRATPDGDEGFEVLRVNPPRALILGGLFDPVSHSQLSFAAPRPERYWHVSWAFVLEPLGVGETRLLVRARAAFSERERLHAAWIRPVHHFMERAQLRGLAARVEGLLPKDGVREVTSGLVGASEMALRFLTLFLRGARSHWGLDEKAGGRDYPGDDLVRHPRWSWTHGIEIDAPAEVVWPWVAQIGADRAGFYSYQWLENLVGCELRNAETLHPEWAHRPGDALVLHPKAPIPVTEVEPGRHFIAHAPREAGESWVTVSWLFLVEPLSPGRSRFISRFRSACSEDLATRIACGPLLVEPVGFVMDRRMLQGVKERAERRNPAQRGSSHVE